MPATLDKQSVLEECKERGTESKLGELARPSILSRSSGDLTTKEALLGVQGSGAERLAPRKTKSLKQLRCLSLQSDRSDHASSLRSEYDLHFPEYQRERYVKINKDYRSGAKLINISATGIMFECAAKILEEVNRDLYEIVCSGKLMSYRMVRKFVVDYLQLDDFAVACYAAM